MFLCLLCAVALKKLLSSSTSKVIVSYSTSKHVSNYYIGLPCSLVFILLIRKCECHLKPLTKSGSLQTMHLDQLCQILCHHRI